MPVLPHFSDRKVVRWGIIGCGNVTEVKSGPGFQQASGSSLVAVMRRDRAKAEDYARRHGVPRFYDEADALLGDPEVDAVYVATPPDSHADYALKAAEAGKPAYVEKPMARNTPECDRMLAAFTAARLPLFVAYYRRRMPRFLKVEEIIRSGALGQITGVNYRLTAPQHLAPAGWRFDAAAAAGGLFVDQGSHVLDLLDYLLGPVTEAAGNAANLASPYAVEDTVALTFRAGGVPGAMTCNFANIAYEDSLRISGSAGELNFSVFGAEPIRLQTGKGLEQFEGLPRQACAASPDPVGGRRTAWQRGPCPGPGDLCAVGRPR